MEKQAKEMAENNEEAGVLPRGLLQNH